MGWGGDKLWFINTTEADGESQGRRMQVYVLMYKLCAYIMTTNGAYMSPPTAPSAPPSGQIHSSTFTKQVVASLSLERVNWTKLSLHPVVPQMNKALSL